MQSNFSTIQEFNEFYSHNYNCLNLSCYFKEIQNIFYKNLDIKFMNYYLQICQHENEFVVEHNKLQEFKVINIIRLNTIINKLNNNSLIEQVDYIILKFGDQKEYKLTPNALKVCLSNSKASAKYFKYYNLLDEIFKNYQEYKLQYQPRLNKKICNCLFRCISLIKYGNDSKYENIINELIDYVLINKEYCKTHLSSYSSMDSWIFCTLCSINNVHDILNTDDHSFILYILTRMMKRKINIISDSKLLEYGQDYNSDPIKLILNNQHYSVE